MLLFLHSIAWRCHRRSIPFVPYALKMLIFVAFRCLLYPEASIGKGTKLRRQGWCIGIFPGAEIGRNCDIHNQVEIAHGSIDLDMRNMEANPVRIVIQDNVTILPGAKILCKGGTLTIGEGSVVGANAVVLSDVPPFSFVSGIPARPVCSYIVEMAHDLWISAVLEAQSSSSSREAAVTVLISRDDNSRSNKLRRL